jgi:hypothetical protein
MMGRILSLLLLFSYSLSRLVLSQSTPKRHVAPQRPAPTDFNSDTEMHVTYASPGTAQYYRQNGKFADGTVLVEETFVTDHAQMTTGDARWASTTKVWFVMSKDAKNRPPQ